MSERQPPTSTQRLDMAQLARADAAYTPIAPFEAWLNTHIDNAAWDAARRRLELGRDTASSEDLRRAVETAMRAAAIDTGAIEGLYTVDRGFTISIAMQTVAWQAVLNEKGPPVRELFEAQLQAYELALDAATERVPITEAWIRRLHEEVCRPQRTVRVLTDSGWQDQVFTKGRYKVLPNHPWTVDGPIHSYAPVADTPAEMHHLVTELRSPAFGAAHPVLQAAYAHHGLVAIHPFQDGNGRVARALASVYLYRATSVPLVIFDDQKQDYFESLSAADNGNRQPFVDFILDRAVDAMDLVSDAIGSAVEERLGQLQQLLISQGGLSHAEIDEIGYRLLDVVASAFEERIRTLSVPSGVQFGTQKQPHADFPADPHYRLLLSRGSPSVMVWSQVTSPAPANYTVHITLEISLDTNARYPLRLRAHGTDDVFDIRISDIYPSFSSVLQLRLDTWVGRILSALVTGLQEQTKRALNGG